MQDEERLHEAAMHADASQQGQGGKPSRPLAPHVHNAESQRRIINRLSRIEGHVRGVKTMVQNDTHCTEVLIQIAAVRGALDRVARLILDEHLNECVARAARAGDIETELEELKKILDRFLP